MGEQRERPKRWAKFRAGKRWWAIPFVWIEWICDWIAYWLSRWAFISILEYLGRLAIVLALVLWIVEIPERKQAQEIQRKVKIFQAWQVINTAQSGSGGRHLALRDLIDEGQSLANVDLSQVRLTEPDLSGANLHLANLSGANLTWADLSGASLFRGNFSGAYLNEADFGGADLSGANLSGANLYLVRQWRQIRDFRLANLWDVKNAPEGFLEWAIGEKGAVSIENYDEWQAMMEGTSKQRYELYGAWKKKWDEEHGDRE